ncbi:MAG: hypothetical protein APF76_00800 [Desulfitibacter sp. BRH_c19]|nr:MAG: hypothetical protein APF76_00800 [Desulfitibacter sp. BRH_c19]
MRKITDRIILGMVSGLIAGIPGRLINSAEYRAGYTDLRYNHLASSLFIPKNKTNSTEGKLLAAFVNNINVSSVGVVISYLLSATGRDKAVVKGMGVAAISWIMINGLVSNLGLKIKSKRPLSPILSLADHLIFGSLTGFLVSKLGDDSLFPDKEGKGENKLPLISTNDDD